MNLAGISSPCVPGGRGTREWYISVYGPLPDHIHVLHKCDNGSCRNPEHIFTGTHKDNMRDMHEKGRHVGNSGNKLDNTWKTAIAIGHGKITIEQVKAIRNTPGKGDWEWVKELGITRHAVYEIRTYKTWKNV